MILIALFMISCDNDNGYSENVKAVKKVVSAFELGDIEIWKEAVSEDLVYSPPMYGTVENSGNCLLYTSPSPRDRTRSRMPSSA